MVLTALDIIVIVVILLSAALAMVRGFVREVLSIASWVLAALAAYLLYPTFLPIVQPYFESATVALVITVFAVFFVALLMASYITMRISDWVIDSRIGPVDRAAGFLFGAGRGVLLLVIAMWFFDFLVPNPPTWVANASTRPFLEDLGEQLVAMLPEDIEATIDQRLRGGETPSDAPPPDAAPGSPAYDGSSLDQLIQSSGQ